MDGEFRLVLCTCPDQATAEAIAARLVDGRLAACVSLVSGVLSIYRWEGEVQRDQEVLMLSKTTAERLDALTASIRQLHPYDVPEIIAVPICAGLSDYLSWLSQCTKS